MTDRSLVTAVLTNPSRTFNRWAVARRAHHPNVATADVAPTEYPTLAMVGQALLRGLGKDHDLSVAKAPALAVAAGWLSTGEISDVFIIDAHLLPPNVLSEVIVWLSSFNVRCWLLLSVPGADWFDPATAAHLQLVADHGGETFDETEMRSRFPDVTRPVKTPPARPRLPRVDGIMFRSTCRQVLTDEHFASVDAEFVGLVREMRAEFQAITGTNKTRVLARSLKARLEATPDTEALVLNVRAAQVATLTSGFHMSVNTTMLLGAEAALPRSGRAVSERWWELLDRYRDPSFGAVAALYAHGAFHDELPAVTVGDVQAPAADGSVTVCVAGSPVVVSAPAARFITAQVGFRHATGAQDEDMLLVSHRAGNVRAALVADLLCAPGPELGIAIAVRPVRTRPLDAVPWLKRYGIRIEKLEHNPTDIRDVRQ